MVNTTQEETKMKTGKEQIDKLPIGPLWTNKDLVGYIVMAFAVGFFIGTLCWI